MMKKLINAFSDITSRLQSHHSQDATQPALNIDDSKASRTRLAWPPSLTCLPQVLGEVTDNSGRQYPRDIGRTVHLGGRTYYMFGDTFCFDDKGDFQGLTNNSIALVPDLRNPIKSQYLSHKVKIPEFVPFTVEEQEFNDKEENKNENRRLVNWAFGGIIEIPGSWGREAWLFFDQVEILGPNPVKQNGIGVAKAKVVGPHGEIKCERVGSFPLFPGDGPLWGNISNISAPDGWTYLLSGIGSELGLDNYIGRIKTDCTDFTDTKNYQFLKKSGAWESTYSAPYGPFGELAHDVLAGQGQGAIIHIPHHSPQGKPYLWIGCEKFPTSQLCMAAAAKPEGPWEVYKLGEMPKLTENAKTRYCIYPHLWGSHLGKGEMLITWSDDGTFGGKVGAGLFTFAVV